MIRDCLGKLSTCNRELVQAQYRDGDPASSLAERFHLSKDNVRQSPVRLLFIPEDKETYKQDGPAQAEVKQEGSFHVPGLAGKGLPTGSYKVAIVLVTGGKELLVGRCNETNSKIFRTGGKTSENFEIDLDTGR